MYQDTLINQSELYRSQLKTLLQNALDTQFDDFIGAEPFERTENRRGQRNGTYERVIKTRAGSIELTVCRDREGNFKHDVFDRYLRSEKAFAIGIIEMVLSGVSTRKITAIYEELFGLSISKSQASALVSKIEPDIQQWRMRPLVQKYDYIMVDARYEKVRENGRVVSKAFVVTVGITPAGQREILGTWVINSESFEAWNTCFAELKERGLKGVEYIVSDENAGLRAAIEKHFQGAQWQRCQVHFMRNLISKLAKSEQPEAIRLLQDLFAAPSKETALERVKPLVAYLTERKKSSVAHWIEDSIEDTLGVYSLPEEHRIKMRTTNMVERLNSELKRRSRVMRIFPNIASCLRILTAVAIELSEDWEQRRYLSM